MPSGLLVSFGGHHRVAGMKQLGETTIPARVTSWSDMSAKTQQTWLQRFPNIDSLKWRHGFQLETIMGCHAVAVASGWIWSLS